MSGANSNFMNASAAASMYYPYQNSLQNYHLLPPPPTSSMFFNNGLYNSTLNTQT